MALLFCLSHRPDHKTSVMARNAVVFLLPGKRIFGEKGKSAIDRCINARRRRRRAIGQRESRQAKEGQGCNDFSHTTIGRTAPAIKTPLSRLSVHVQYTGI